MAERLFLLPLNQPKGNPAKRYTQFLVQRSPFFPTHLQGLRHGVARPRRLAARRHLGRKPRPSAGLGEGPLEGAPCSVVFNGFSRGTKGKSTKFGGSTFYFETKPDMVSLSTKNPPMARLWSSVRNNVMVWRDVFHSGSLIHHVCDA